MHVAIGSEDEAFGLGRSLPSTREVIEKMILASGMFTGGHSSWKMAMEVENSLAWQQRWLWWVVACDHEEREEIVAMLAGFDVG